MKYSIFLSIFIYKPWLANEGGLNLRVAYPTYLISKQKDPISNIIHVAGTYDRAKTSA